MNLICQGENCSTRIHHLNHRRKFCTPCAEKRRYDSTIRSQKKYNDTKNAEMKGYTTVSDRADINSAREKWLLDNHYDLPRKSGNGYE